MPGSKPVGTGHLPAKERSRLREERAKRRQLAEDLKSAPPPATKKKK